MTSAIERENWGRERDRDEKIAQGLGRKYYIEKLDALKKLPPNQVDQKYLRDLKKVVENIHQLPGV